jgi:ribonucleoside-diphosphate reductase alpha chain
MVQRPVSPLSLDPFELAPIARRIWDLKYRLKTPDGEPLETSVEDTWRRVAEAAASAERGGKRVRARWAEQFYEAMAGFEVLPAGRILAGAGTRRRVTLFNCFVMGPIDDDLGSIFENVKEAALTMQQGGGIGHDFSTLRPMGAPVVSTGSDASGPVSFMDVWDAMCRTIMSAGSRRGAMMGTMRCDHPDIEQFIAAKGDERRLRNFNLSVLVTDAFIAAVREGKPWALTFAGKVYKTVDARALWHQLMRATYDYAEPGVIFIDRVNRDNNLSYCEEIHATNPCGEQPLPPYGACLLGSINLARLVDRPFAQDAALDTTRLEQRVRTAVRLLDNMIEVSGYPLPAQREEARAKRRIGLGVTGLADTLIMVGQRYGSPAAATTAESWMARLEQAAYEASAELGAEKGTFPLYDAAKFLASPNVQRLPAETRDAIARHGIRNGCLTSVAPTGTISLLAGNVSSGVEPVFDFTYERRLQRADGSHVTETVSDYAYAVFRDRFGPDAPLPDTFVTTASLTPHQHLEMQAALQRHVDSSISKTINCPADMGFAEFENVYLEAFALGLKGCTTFRPNPVTGAVLTAASTPVSGPAAMTDARLPPSSAAGHAHAPPPARSASAVGAAASVHYMARPLERDAVLAGYTYKLRWPGSDHAIYVTINDIERDGRRRPFEVFINTKNLEHYAWTVALTRMISAVFRRGGDVSFVVEELKAVFDPQGGHWIGGRYVPSLLAAIGEIIERHMIRIGFLQGEAGIMAEADVATLEVPHERPERAEAAAGATADRDAELAARSSSGRGRPCPRCHQPTLVREEGCWVCKTCSFSRCS